MQGRRGKGNFTREERTKTGDEGQSQDPTRYFFFLLPPGVKRTSQGRGMIEKESPKILEESSLKGEKLIRRK